eukprot:5457720-Pleurochrysis_carterae.AAC.1
MLCSCLPFQLQTDAACRLQNSGAPATMWPVARLSARHLGVEMGSSLLEIDPTHTTGCKVNRRTTWLSSPSSS